MKTRAAVAFEAGKPLEIVELDLDGILEMESFHGIFSCSPQTHPEGPPEEPV